MNKRNKNNKNARFKIRSFPHKNLGVNPILFTYEIKPNMSINNERERELKYQNNLNKKNNTFKQLNIELQLQRNLHSLGLSPNVNSNFVNVQRLNNKNYPVKAFYSQRMTPLKYFSTDDINIITNMLQSFDKNVTTLIEELGYINLDMKEDNLILDTQNGNNVLFIDTDPTFFIKIIETNNNNNMIERKIIDGVRFISMIFLLLHPYKKNNIFGYNSKYFQDYKIYFNEFFSNFLKTLSFTNLEELKESIINIQQLTIENGAEYKLYFMLNYYLFYNRLNLQHHNIDSIIFSRIIRKLNDYGYKLPDI